VFVRRLSTALLRHRRWSLRLRGRFLLARPAPVGGARQARLVAWGDGADDVLDQLLAGWSPARPLDETEPESEPAQAAAPRPPTRAPSRPAPEPPQPVSDVTPALRPTPPVVSPFRPAAPRPVPEIPVSEPADPNREPSPDRLRDILLALRDQARHGKPLPPAATSRPAPAAGERPSLPEPRQPLGRRVVHMPGFSQLPESGPSRPVLPEGSGDAAPDAGVNVDERNPLATRAVEPQFVEPHAGESWVASAADETPVTEEAGEPWVTLGANEAPVTELEAGELDAAALPLASLDATEREPSDYGWPGEGTALHPETPSPAHLRPRARPEADAGPHEASEARPAPPDPQADAGKPASPAAETSTESVAGPAAAPPPVMPPQAPGAAPRLDAAKVDLSPSPALTALAPALADSPAPIVAPEPAQAADSVERSADALAPHAAPTSQGVAGAEPEPDAAVESVPDASSALTAASSAAPPAEGAIAANDSGEEARSAPGAPAPLTVEAAELAPELGPPEPPRPSTRALLRPAAGIDPGDVPIFRGPQVARLVRAFAADALSVDGGILVGDARAEESPEGLGLLAHELAHVARASASRYNPPVVAARAPSLSSDEEAIAVAAEAAVIEAVRSPRLPARGAAGPGEADVGSQPEQPRDRTAWGRLPAPWEPWPEATPARPAPTTSTLAPVPSPAPPSPSPSLPPPEAPPVAAPSLAAAAPAAPRAAAIDRPQAVAQTPPPEEHDRAPAEAEPDLDALAQQVFRVLKRRLAAERRRSTV
jgi:hypothetical protein